MSSYEWPNSEAGDVTSVNGLTGAVTLAAGTNITLVPSGNTITINAAGGGGGSISIGDAIGGATAGSLLYIDAGTNLAQDNSHLFYDYTNLRVGFGTSSPKDSLHIGQSTINGTMFSQYQNLGFGTTYTGVLLQKSSSIPVHSIMGPVGLGVVGLAHNGTSASPTTVANSNLLFQIGFGAWDGSDFQIPAGIRSVVTGVVSSGVVPADIIFDTAATGFGSESFRIKSSKVLQAAGLASTGIIHTDSSGNFSTSLIVNADVSASAAIAYSKLTLTGSIVNADINASAAIAYSKLALTGSIVNADINASAAIAFSKLASLATGHIIAGNAGVATDVTVSGDVTIGATGVTAIGAGKVTNAMLAGSITASNLVGSDIATVGTVTSGTWSATTIALNKGGTGQTTKAAAFDALQPMTTGGDLIYGGASGTGTRLANGTAGQYLKSTGGTTAPAWQSFAQPTAQIFNSTGTTAGRLFTVTSANATVGATYTNNSQTFTVLETISGSTRLFTSGVGAPLSSGTLTKATGTGDSSITFSASQTLAAYTTPANCVRVHYQLVGGGGGGGGAGNSGGNDGGTGNPSAFGPSFSVALGGGGGVRGSSTPTGGAGGSTSPASGIIGFSVSGGSGAPGAVENVATNFYLNGGSGGASFFAGGGMGGVSTTVPTSSPTNSGAGGGGGGVSGTTTAGSGGGGGGGAGGYVEGDVSSPAATLYYTIGTGGTAGSAGTIGTGSATAGAAAADGKLVVWEYYQ